MPGCTASPPPSAGAGSCSCRSQSRLVNHMTPRDSGPESHDPSCVIQVAVPAEVGDGPRDVPEEADSGARDIHQPDERLHDAVVDDMVAQGGTVARYVAQRPHGLRNRFIYYPFNML